MSYSLGKFQLENWAKLEIFGTTTSFSR